MDASTREFLERFVDQPDLISRRGLLGASEGAEGDLLAGSTATGPRELLPSHFPW